MFENKSISIAQRELSIHDVDYEFIAMSIKLNIFIQLVCGSRLRLLSSFYYYVCEKSNYDVYVCEKSNYNACVFFDNNVFN